MKESYININGENWWSGYDSQFQLKDQFQSSCNFVSNDEPNKFNIIANESIGIQPKEQKFTVVGTLTNNDGVFSGFSKNNYIQIPQIITTTPTKYECVLCVKTPSSWNSSLEAEAIGLNALDYDFWMLRFETGYNSTIAGALTFSTKASSNSWSTTMGSHGLLPNTKYYIKISWNGTKWTVAYSTNNISYTTTITHTASWPSNSSSFYCLGNSINSWSGNCPFRGSIDLNESYIKVNDELWWKGYIGNDFYNNTSIAPYTLVNNVLVGCLVNYEDNGSANILKAYKVSYTDDSVGVVLSTDDTFTLENMGEKTYLADVVIPNHKLFTYGEKTVKKDWKNSKLTTNGTMGGTSNACQASGYYSSSYYPYYAFDETTNYWHSNNTKPQWITYYTPTEVYVDTIKITLSDYNPMFFEIQGSNNNTTWTTLVDDLNKINTSGKTLEIPVNSENPYKYIRLVNKKGYNSTYTTIREMVIYGHTLNSENGWIPVESMWNPMGE
jgi:hypothetical protein